MPGASVPGPLDAVKKPTSVKDGTTPLQPGGSPAPAGAGPAGPPTAATSPAGGALIKIDPPDGYDKASDLNPIFSITDAPKMPSINVTFTVVGVTGADPSPTTDFSWTVAVSFDSSKCPCGLHKKTKKPRIIVPVSTSGTSKGGKVTIDLGKIGLIRGGDLKITVTATVGGQILKGETKGWRVQGTNPSKADVANAMADDTHRKIACVESGMKQFFQAPDEGNAWYPYFSGDELLGVGICQLTNPEPTEDQIWNWKDNVAGGLSLYKEKKKTAQGYPGQVAKATNFLNLVAKYNQSLKAQSAAAPSPGSSPAQPGGPTAPQATPPTGAASGTSPTAPVAVTVPEFTADQLEDDTIRGFNGWAGDDGFVNPKLLHEFRNRGGQGYREPGGGGRSEDAESQSQVGEGAGFDRPGAGDSSYIDDVKNRDPKTCAKVK